MNENRNPLSSKGKHKKLNACHNEEVRRDLKQKLPKTSNQMMPVEQETRVLLF